MIEGPGHGKMDQPLIANCLRFMEKLCNLALSFLFWYIDVPKRIIMS